MRLTVGARVVLVDARDAHLLLAHSWQVQQNERRLYVACKIAGRKTYLHQLICPGAEFVDHRNGDGLDNRRNNLRPATRQENARNTAKRLQNTTSRYKGVYWHAQRQKWCAQLTLGGRVRKSLGLHTSEVAAARAYDAAARQHFGEFAALNFPSAGERAA